MKSSNWQTVKLGEYASFLTGKIDSNAATPDGEYPFFTCSRETFRTSTFAFDTECVLLAGNNAAGIFPIKYFKGKFDAYQRTYVIEPLDRTKLNTRFLYYTLQLQLEYMKNVSTGAATKFLTKTILDNLEIKIPKFEIQHKIADILSAYDDLIENNTRRIRILEQMAQSVYHEWFGKVDEKSLPKGWKEKPLFEVCEKLTSGGTPSRTKPEYWADGEIEWFKTKELDDSFLFCSEERISQLGFKNSSAKIFLPGTVVMAIYAAPTVGRLGILTQPSTFNQAACGLTPKEGMTTTSFLFYKLLEMRDYFNSLAQGAAQQNISVQKVSSAKIWLPPYETIKEFDKLAVPLMNLKRVLQAKNSNLRRTRDLLLPRLVSGEISVDEME
jgi:type I restriction enzyme, S subunit